MSETIECTTCKEVKPEEEFYKHKKGKYGREKYCKPCRLKYARKYREENRDKAYAAQRRWGKKNKKRLRELDVKSKAKHHDRVSARTHMNNAIYHGIVIRGDKCEDCGSTLNIQCHHFDYSKPLEVVWLCRKCHVLLHKNINRRLKEEDYSEECEICIFFKFGQCRALGDTSTTGDCQSFKD